jgi:type 2 lantibiotic biosynthesis protein LanM
MATRIVIAAVKRRRSGRPTLRPGPFEPVLWRALYLSERVAWLRRTGFTPVSARERKAFELLFRTIVTPEEARHWERWQRVRRFTADEHVAAARAEPPTRTCPLKLGPWRRALDEVLSPAGCRGPFSIPGPVGTGLHRLLAPFARWAQLRLEEPLSRVRAAGAAVDLEGLSSDLMADLSLDLARAADRTLILELNIARMQGQLPGEDSAARTRAFTDSVLSSPARLRALYRRYPALARLLATICGSWVNGVAEMLTAWADDRDEVVARIFTGRDPGPLTGLGPGSGDPHEGGRRVRVLRFAGGARVVYKPRPLDVDVELQRIVAWMNEGGLATPLPVLQVVRRPTHGWTSFVDHEPAEDTAAIRRYYYRLGALLPLLWIVRGTDFHFENVIAQGEWPMLIDLEMLFSNSMSGSSAIAPGPSEPPAQKMLRDSVLEAGILPSQPVSADRKRPSEDVSALGKREGQAWKNDLEFVRDAGTDAMRVERGTATLPPSANLPRLGGREVDVVGYEGDLLAGMRDAHASLLRARETLLEPAGLLAGAARASVRHVVRPTLQYGTLLGRACHPNRLADALRREYYLAPRLAGFLSLGPRLRAIVPREFEELVDFDIPRFTARPAARSLWRSDGRELRTFFDRSALALCRQRIRDLTADSAARQEEVARLSLVSLRVGAPHEHTHPHGGPSEPVSPASPPPSAGTLVREAREIAHWCRERCVVEGGRAEWFGLLQNQHLQVSLGPSGADLYGGAAGLALFLTTLARLDPASDVQDLALSATRLARRALGHPAAGGAFDGRGGIAYALLHVGSALGRQQLVDEALAALLAVSDQAEGDEILDVIGGSAGMVAVLLAFARATGSTRALDAATRFGDRLIAKRIAQERGCAWPNAIASHAPLTGVAHGAGGIAWALLRLGAATGERRFADCGRDGLRYEQAAFDPVHRNWPDFRLPAGQRNGNAPAGWCYGAPGIGLTRLTLPAEAVGEPERAEIDLVLQGLVELPAHANDSLCHGELGNLETLVRASELLERPELLDRARERAGRVAARRGRSGQWRSGLEGTREPVPGLFLGMAGIGYQLLRLAHPELVPSVLVLEPPRRHPA